MYARVSTFQSTAEGIEASLERSPQVVGKAEALDGFKGLYYLVDRESGKSLAVTLWDSVAAMKASETAADQIRDGEATRSGDDIISVERFEVATAELR